MKHRFLRLAAVLFAATLATLLAPGNFASAAPTETVGIGMPFVGEWGWNGPVSPPYTDKNSSHPSVHHTPGGGDWGTDLYGSVGTPVKLNLFSPSGTLSFAWMSSGTSCGTSTRVKIFVDNVEVGWIYFAHISGAVTSGNITNGMTLGYVANHGCNPANHIHIEVKNATDRSCFNDLAMNTAHSEGAWVGNLGKPGVANIKSVCPTGTTPGEINPPQYNEGVVTVPGNWTGDVREDFAYITPNGSGFNVAVMQSNVGPPIWAGLWWSEPNQSFQTTKFIPVDWDGNGIKDLLYATARSGGFDMALMHNNGSGFNWWGQKWNPNLNLGLTKFIPGNWAGDTREEFAYVTPRSSGGFDFAVMETTDNGLVWRGLWWSDDNLKFDTTKFVPADNDNDGYTDLYYASPRSGGFDMALMHNVAGSQFIWWGQKWNPNLPLDKTRFLPGNWGGDGAGDFAYVTPRGDSGFDLAAIVTTPNNSSLVWQERLHEPGLAYATVQFVPANTDTDAGGYTDLYYATPRGGGGFDMARFQNNGTSFSWAGQQWNPTSLDQQKTMFLPQG